MNYNRTSGFTLIELSIVLVIIGLIIGGVFVGQDLIRSAGERAVISQIEKYNQAVNTFRGKYGELPGDIDANAAASFGFAARGAAAGQGDGNGVIEGSCHPSNGCIESVGETAGETALFWEDLSAASLIDAQLNTATCCTFPTQALTGTSLDLYLPEAKVGGGNYIYVWSGGSTANSGSGDGNSYFGLSATTQLDVSNIGWAMASNPGLSVKQAYDIDVKVDDGLPQSGRVMAWYVNYNLQHYAPVFAAGGGAQGAFTQNGANTIYPSTAATQGTSTTCYDNGNATGTQQYSITQNNGSAMNCALSFKFQ